MRTAQYEDIWGSLVLVFFTDGGISSCADKVSNSTAKTGPMETADISVLLLFQTGVPWNRCSISLLEKELSLARSLARSLSLSTAIVKFYTVAVLQTIICDTGIAGQGWVFGWLFGSFTKSWLRSNSFCSPSLSALPCQGHWKLHRKLRCYSHPPWCRPP